MAQRDEHRMVFDIRGRRGVAIKIVYAILALLMVASLFLVTGAVNINSLFGNNNTGESAASSLEKQAEGIEARLAKSPGDENLLANLTRTRINTANAMITNGAGESQDGVEEVKQQLALASEDWSKYIAAARDPAAGLAIQAAPALFQLAELSPSGQAAMQNIKAATEAQEIVAEKRNDLNAWSTLAFYALFTQDYKKAEEAKEESIKFANTKFERESFENKYEEVEKNAKSFGKQLQAEKAAASKASGKESLENPTGGLGNNPLGSPTLGGG
jgi:hypothetical protein